MRPYLDDNVIVAYKKLKQMVHFEKHPLKLRKRLAEFECGKNFADKLATVSRVLSTDEPHETPEFQAWLSEISFEIIPKVVNGPDKRDESQGSYVTNLSGGSSHLVSRVNYLFDGPIELHLVSVLWLMTEGQAYDRILSNHCLGSRLHEFVGNFEDHSAYLFKKYHELYAKWRDDGIQKARDLLSKDKQSVCVVGLDIQEYYYRIRIDWEKLRSEITRPVPEHEFDVLIYDREIFGEKLFKCIEDICKEYQKDIRPMLAETHHDLSNDTTCLPIGFSASPVIANWYLKVFDDAILESVRPAYYGRYVDDIMMVVAMSEPPEESDPIMSFMNRILVKSEIIRWEKKNAGFELCSRPGLFLQKKKCNLQFLDADHSAAGLDKFQKQIDDNASAFALLPVDGDESPVAQVAYDLLYDGSANKFRCVKAVAGNRWELAGHLAKQTQLHLMTEGAVDKDLRDELFRFFKGRNAIDYWDMWERVISFFLVAKDRESADRFSNAIRSEIFKMNYPPLKESATNKRLSVTRMLREAMIAHLDLCMELSLAATSITGEGSTPETRLWRSSNLIRHHLVAIPLLNYTGFEGDLTAPENAKGLVIDERKAVNTPRFVHFDECLGFVDSGCAQRNKKDSVTRANEVYKQFHGDVQGYVTNELVGEGDLK